MKGQFSRTFPLDLEADCSTSRNIFAGGSTVAVQSREVSFAKITAETLADENCIASLSESLGHHRYANYESRLLPTRQSVPIENPRQFEGSRQRR